MLVKVIGALYVEVEDEETAQAASSLLDSSLLEQIDSSGFPHGELVHYDVDHYEKVTAEEAQELGLVE